jgi:2-oxoglutarate dehydrogenase E2 component (dihydrolipoamide succinyltransferase)
VLKEDVARAKAEAKAEPAAAPTTPAPTAPSPATVPAGATAGVERVVPMSRIRKRIAERLVQAQHTAAILTTFNEIDMTAVLGARERYKKEFEERHGVKLGFMSFFARACILALRELPEINAEIRDADIVSNGGVYGSLLSTPILNPPQSGILGMHKIEKRPIVVDDQIVIRPMMYVALSYDHRIVDGEQAVTFLVRVKQRLEDPERMLLEV